MKGSLRVAAAASLGSCVALLLASLGGAKGGSVVDPMRHNIFSVTDKTFDSVVNRHRNNGGVVVLAYLNGENPKFIDNVFNKAAVEMKGLLKFAAVNCDASPAFCKQNMNPDLKSPHVVIFPPNPLPPVVAEDGSDMEWVKKRGLAFIPGDHITEVTAKTVEPFVLGHLSLPKVLLFSKKETPSVLYKALSNSFADRVLFGFVPPSETALFTRYKITSAPALIALSSASAAPTKGRGATTTPTAPTLSSFSTDRYKGEMTFEALHAWVNVRAETFVKGGGFSSEEDAAVAPKPWMMTPVPEVTGPSHQDICFRGSTLCVIYLSKGKISEEALLMLEELADLYPLDQSRGRGAAFKFMWIDLELEKNFREFFEVSDLSELPSISIVNPHKKLRRLSLPSGTPVTKEALMSLIDTVLAGNGRFKVVKGQKIPTFAIRGSANADSKEEL